ncbi:trypsin-3 [Eurytemora carolleeae]|uniref:trypsin-3 n=1 Tax=Eurytemora carolleeae TaxID=1294199 RepID=UPI000C772442|nr:trypsin-3 [Eurytemora carolleeae]|eukprot:XP_023334576.1 trypsin-3-like [Eurytemora affinis]
MTFIIIIIIIIFLGSLSESIQTVNFDLNPTCTEGLLCAKKEERCQGDHGGPLIQKNQLVGVVSKSLGCSSANSPASFTQVSKYINWISATMKENGGDTTLLC